MLGVDIAGYFYKSAIKKRLKVKRKSKSILSYYMAGWSVVKRSILIGFLSGLDFAIRTAKMECSRIDFTDLCS